VQHGLHVESEEEEHRQEAGQGDHLGGISGGDAPDPQDRERDERVADAQLVDDESGQGYSRDGELGDRARRAPADVGCLHERVDEQQHPTGHEQGAQRVEVRQGCRLAALPLEQEEGTEKSERAEGDIDEQHPAPARPLGKQAAEQHAGSAADARDGSPDTEGGVAVTRRTKRARQRRQRGRREHRGAQSLGEAGADEQRAALCEAAEQRRTGEDNQAGDEDEATAEQIGHTSAEQQEAAVGEDVAVDDPQQALLAEAEVALDRRQGDVQDRCVEDVHELDEAEQKEDGDASPGGQRRLATGLGRGNNGRIWLCTHETGSFPVAWRELATSVCGRYDALDVIQYERRIICIPEHLRERATAT
jgi:hypothetical protein